MNDKKIVLFDGTKSVCVINFMGKDKAFLTPINHPSIDYVTNEKEVITSEVVTFVQEGSVYVTIETQNTIYWNSLKVST